MRPQTALPPASLLTTKLMMPPIRPIAAPMRVRVRTWATDLGSEVFMFWVVTSVSFVEGPPGLEVGRNIARRYDAFVDRW